MAWLPDGEKKIDDTFIRFDTTHERDKQTNRQTPHDGKNHTFIFPKMIFTVKS